VTSASDQTEVLVDQVRGARCAASSLVLRGEGSKDFLYSACEADTLDLTTHRGIVDYEPSELVVTARCGTPLKELTAVLDASRQMLPFEPPQFGGGTIGGALAAGFAGPGRPWTGSARDAVLGVRLLNGYADVLDLGGRVMKNVAGYDLSRLLVGAHGTLGVLLAASIKVLPRPEAECTLAFSLPRESALARVIEWGQRPWPITATCHHGDALVIRLSGTEAGIADARSRLGGDPVADGTAFWTAVRDHRHRFFTSAREHVRLWRLSLPIAAPYPDIEGDWLTEWGGALRWLVTTATADRIRAESRRLGGHAHGFSERGGFEPLPAVAMTYHARLKAAFDPDGIFNPGRYPVTV